MPKTARARGGRAASGSAQGHTQSYPFPAPASGQARGRTENELTAQFFRRFAQARDRALAGRAGSGQLLTAGEVAGTGGSGFSFRQGGRIYGQLALLNSRTAGSGSGLPSAVCQVGPFAGNLRANQFTTLGAAASWAAANFPEGCVIEVFRPDEGIYLEDVTFTSSVQLVGMSVATSTLVTYGSWRIWIAGTVTVQPPATGRLIQFSASDIGFEDFVATSAEADATVHAGLLEFRQCEFGSLFIEGGSAVSMLECFLSIGEGALFTGSEVSSGPAVCIQGGLVTGSVTANDTQMFLTNVTAIAGQLTLGGDASAMVVGGGCLSTLGAPAFNVIVEAYSGSFLCAFNTSLADVTVIGAASGPPGLWMNNSSVAELTLDLRNTGMTSNAFAEISNSRVGFLIVEDAYLSPNVTAQATVVFNSIVDRISLGGYANVQLIDTSYTLASGSFSPNCTLGRSPVFLYEVDADGTYQIAPKLPDANYHVIFTQTSGTASTMPLWNLGSSTGSSLAVSGVPSGTNFRAMIVRDGLNTNNV